MFKSIDTSFPRVANPRFNLTDLQQSLLYCMITMETYPYVDDQDTVYTNAGFVMESTSIGKTTVAAALVNNGLAPWTHKNFFVSKEVNGAYVSMFEQVHMIDLPVAMILTDQDGVSQWQSILSSTDLRITKILTLKDIDEFDVKRPTDVVLVKHGTYKRGDMRESILKEIKKKLEGYRVNRFIVDNFTSLRITYSDQIILSAFTWIIGKQHRNCVGNMKISTNPKMDAFIYDDYYDNPILQLCKDDNLRDCFTLTFSRKVVEKIMNMPKLNEFVVVYKDILSIPEETMTSMCYAFLIDQTEAVDRILYVKNRLNAFDADSKQVMTDVRRAFHKKIPRKKFLEYAFKELSDEISRVSVPIQRLFKNVADNECKCCLVPFESADDVIFVLHCCQAIMCNECYELGIKKCPNCMSKIVMMSKIKIAGISTTDINILIDNFSNVSALDRSPHIQAIVDAVAGKTIVVDPPSKTFRELSSLGVLDAPRSGKCVVFCNKDLTIRIKRELEFEHIDAIVCDHLRILPDPKSVSTLILCGHMSTKTKRRVANYLYNCSERGCNLNIIRIEAM